MTAANAYRYHPTIFPHDRVKRLNLESEADGEMLLERLRGIYSDHRDDLNDATLWKVSTSSSVAQVSPRWLSELASTAVDNDSN